MTHPLLSVIVPCYNEEAVLPELKRRLESVCRQQVRDAFEVILVNDGSLDGTWRLIQAMVSDSPGFVGVNLARNLGHQLALTAGLSLARGDRVMLIDADLQDPPELLSRMMETMDAGADVVYGRRVAREGESFYKRATAWMFYRFLAVFSEVEIPKDTGEFRLMNRKVVDALTQMPEHHRFIRGMVAWLGFNQVPMLYTRDPRAAGSTKYRLRNMMRFAADAITGFSISPLRLSSMLSCCCLVLSAGVAAYVLYGWFALRVVRGWASLLLMFLIFSGAQLLVLGVIGEYVGRTFVEAKRRPLFVVSEILAHSKNTEPV